MASSTRVGVAFVRLRTGGFNRFVIIGEDCAESASLGDEGLSPCWLPWLCGTIVIEPERSWPVECTGVWSKDRSSSVDSVGSMLLFSGTS